MILDSSAIVAIVMQEPGFEDLVGKLSAATPVGMATPSLAETALVLAGRLGTNPTPLLERFIQEFGIVEIPFGEAHWREAVQAFLKFGKRRHRAALNFGDCMAYAAARLAGQPLLCVGRDFPRTDIELA